MTETPKPVFSEPSTTIAKDGLERRVVELVRQLRGREKSYILTVKLNSDGTWQLFTGEPVRG